MMSARECVPPTSAAADISSAREHGEQPIAGDEESAEIDTRPYLKLARTAHIHTPPLTNTSTPCVPGRHQAHPALHDNITHTQPAIGRSGGQAIVVQEEHDSEGRGEGRVAGEGVLPPLEVTAAGGRGEGVGGGGGEGDRAWMCCVCNGKWQVISVDQRQRHLEQCLCLSYHQPPSPTGDKEGLQTASTGVWGAAPGRNSQKLDLQ